ncbi:MULTISPECIES: 16S rRNA (uracil(1498)-N(3))-methyltransferase [Aliiglaciecola]|uniref:16S rRNA (uracil(1498)-N(3))-methyltransferase n=1 Tax=Aliiglaciecola TaxID=1406885 RepID=UPI001C09FCD6|nr:MULTISPECIES: 16S rRNA (uracil(1498)-N(3))-methyltransferase [Aliiglaciecola]MBU2876570.1 16S rRNA (uracil(1498)-N(3))-methyltransferase [Aliiglaciecola lipolytica]MDO6711495.1 16S rRNA (uracil(1498)-N(3))-methyltransferase [Aliiglaciecola sp. 2_MG-2023]MDO6752528.1 16S rRNA (uracil(1498)-N(3))-methyltransferase [Aliiglaciecola sp. 1_MG-2023]
MRIPRIYHPDLLIVDQIIDLTPDAANHIVSVLRLNEGHPLVLFNGDGNEYSAELVTAKKRQAKVLIDAKLSINVESTLNIHLGQGVSRGDRMDMAIQKAVELGVTEITPLITERCGVKLSAERWEKKCQQWQKLIISACEQCGRNQIPTLHPCTSIHEWTKQSTTQLRLTLHPRAEKSIKHLSIPSSGVKLLIGPEGGFTESEIYATEQVGFQTVQMGPRVLRTETAAIAAIAALQAIHGDL